MKKLPEPIQRGLNRLAGVSGATVVSLPEFMPTEGAWAIKLCLSQTYSSDFVPKETLWVLLVDDVYPLGQIHLYPGLNNSIVHTFPHQDRNIKPHRDDKKWRTGKPCLDSPSQRLGRIAGGSEPTNDSEERLRWHVERCLAWLDMAATKQLMLDSEPFEVPQCPSELLNSGIKVVHDEGPDTFDVWTERIGRFGEVSWNKLPGFEKTIVAEAFFDTKGDVIRTCRRELVKTKKRWVGYWWLWPEPVVIPPWHSPGTWADLRRIGARLNLNVDKFTRWLARRSVGENTIILLIGYPIPTSWNGTVTEIHWQSILPPPIPQNGKMPKRSRGNYRGRSARIQRNIFIGSRHLSYLNTENWHPDRLQARGKLPRTLRKLPIAIIGAGALGSAVAELLIRAGSLDILIVDHDSLEVGNLVRHTLTGAELRQNKAAAVAARLRGAAPMANVSSFAKQLPSQGTLKDLLDRFDVIIDCTGEDEVVSRLGGTWWGVPRLFLSASLGFAARRLFLYEAWGCSFPEEHFFEEIGPWLEGERASWSAVGETLEGAGCWSPLFPARSDDVWLAAVATVKHLERATNGESKCGLDVLEQYDEGGVGFRHIVQEEA
ncbi:HesA/MoeB/ThiF family protein [Lujinxingia vulgaris]|uniref:HesA/MoeB/ThiF family protein n=1 Tax=Lujinxingia vulgaris TaxID=2600176 RepID=UPI001E4CC223|nr:ThiF family adenylyltransferase [Lujinxingia vulgaris]